VALVAIPLARELWQLLLPALLFGAVNGLSIPSIFTLLVGLAPERRRAAFMSVNGMVLRLGQTVGPVLAGALVSMGGLDAAFWGTAVLAAAMTALAAAAIR
jgi:MFS family permease